MLNNLFRRSLQFATTRPGALAAAVTAGGAAVAAVTRDVAADLRAAADQAATVAAAAAPTENDQRQAYQRGRSEAEWMGELTGEQFYIMRMRGTEHPGSGALLHFMPDKGFFACAACSQPLYSASSKFTSTCGWPAFDRAVTTGEGTAGVVTRRDLSLGRARTEIVCGGCGGHLGHVYAAARPDAFAPALLIVLCGLAGFRAKVTQRPTSATASTRFRSNTRRRRCRPAQSRRRCCGSA